MKKEVWLLFFMNIFSAIGYSIVGPLFPLIKSRDIINDELLGWMISTYSLANIIVTPIIPSITKKFGRIQLLYISTFCEATCSVLYGFMNYISSAYILIPTIFLIRFIHGIAASFIITLVYSLTSSISDKENVQSSLGYLEIAWSLGTATGPLCASIFYYLGGYSLSFILLGLVLYISFFLVNILYPSLQKNITNENENDETPSFIGLLFQMKVLMLLLACLMNFIATTFFLPSLTKHLMTNYGLSPSISGLFFTINVISYFFTIQFIDSLSQKLGLYFSVFLGIILSGLGCFFIYPVDPIPKNIFFIILGLIIIGISSAPANVIVLVLIEGLIKETSGNIDEFTANDLSSAMYVLFTCIGDFSGPILGGFFSHNYGFKYSCCLNGLIILCFGAPFLLWNINSIYKEIKKEYKEEGKKTLKEIFLQQQYQIESEYGKEQKRLSISSKNMILFNHAISFRFDALGTGKIGAKYTHKKISRNSDTSSISDTTIRTV